jgi:ubiquinone/menaquinone biosynthesis C-methylase UbiE
VRILDVGCGTGVPPRKAGLSPLDSVIGLDIDFTALTLAKTQFPQRQFLCSRAESLPLATSSLDRVVSAVTMPYTNIPRALAEIKRVLIPGGSLFMSVHNLRFTFRELCSAFPRVVPTAYRLYVLANGVVFYATGRLVRFPNGRVESFQTVRGLKLALKRTGFEEVTVTRPDGRLLIEAKTASSGAFAVAVTPYSSMYVEKKNLD